MVSPAVISGDSLLSATPSTKSQVGGARAIIDGSARDEKTGLRSSGRNRVYQADQPSRAFALNYNRDGIWLASRIRERKAKRVDGNIYSACNGPGAQSR